MESSNNSTSALTPDQWILTFTTAGLILFSTFGMISSFVTILVITVSKSLHTPCFILIAGGAVGSFTVAAHFFVRGIVDILLQAGLIGFRRTGLQCLFLDGIFGLWGIAFHSQMACFVAIDRLVSITFPMRYRHLGKRYALGILACCATITTAQEIAGFATAELHNVKTCTEFQETLTPAFMTAYAGLNLFYCTFNVAIYAAMLICFQLRQKFTKDTASDTFMKQQIAVMPAIKLMTLMYSLSGILAEILISVSLALPWNQGVFFLMALGAVLKDASSVVEGTSLLARSKKFRECLKVLVGWDKNSVVPIATSRRGNSRM